MSSDDWIRTRVDGEQCMVCDRRLSDGHRFCHLQQGERVVALCSPRCVEAFLKDKAGYVSQRAARDRHPFPHSTTSSESGQV